LAAIAARSIQIDLNYLAAPLTLRLRTGLLKLVHPDGSGGNFNQVIPGGGLNLCRRLPVASAGLLSTVKAVMNAIIL
jgi:hypothetical protein